MPEFHEENIVMWRGYAHVVSLMDLLRLRTAGWVAEDLEQADLHLGVLHAMEQYATPADAVRYLDIQAALARQEREATRARRDGNVWVHAEPRRARTDDEKPVRVVTARARNAAMRQRRSRSNKHAA